MKMPEFSCWNGKNVSVLKVPVKKSWLKFDGPMDLYVRDANRKLPVLLLPGENISALNADIKSP